MTNLVFHLGAPSPSFEQLTFSLRKNSFLLSEYNTMARRPGQYRAAIDNALMAQSLGPFSDDNRAELLRKLTMDKSDQRVLLSNPSLLDEPAQIFRDGLFYGRAEQATTALRTLLPDTDMEFLLTVQNPVTMVSDIMSSMRFTTREQFMNGVPFEAVRWSDVVSRIRRANPYSHITIWAYEEAPVMWPKILRHVGGLDDNVEMEGELDLVAPLIGDFPAKRLKEYLAKQTNLSPSARLEIIEGFLARFFDPDVAEQEIDLDGIGPDAIETISQAYEADIERCKAMEGVTVISAF
jgi:hypothetical protein